MVRVSAMRQSMWVRGTMFLLAALLLLIGQVVHAQPGKHALGDIPLPPEIYKKYLKVRPAGDMAAAEAVLPSSYDARVDNIVTPPKDQGSCGSCWAFASTGAMESHLLKDYAAELPTTLDLAEQQLLSCNVYNYGCNGGSSPALLHWDTSSDGKGPAYEACFEYTASGSTPCIENQCDQLPYRVVNWGTVTQTTLGFKTSLFIDGPSYWRYDVHNDFYDYWAGRGGEVYVNHTNDYAGGHAVLLIGWDDSKGAFLCKNSWGKTGGPFGDGTFWIAYDGHANSLNFGMTNFDVIPVGCTTEICDNNEDDDCDGKFDCEDDNCQHSINCTCEIVPGCAGNEDITNCPKDCYCGNSSCDPGEDMCSCPQDCGDIPNKETSCTNGKDDDCDGMVDCRDSDDCGKEVICSCGNGKCDDAETGDNCPSDCYIIGGTCDPCFKGVCNGDCHPVKEGNTCSDCASPTLCGNNICEGNETAYNCAKDCQPVTCGDGKCDPGEEVCGYEGGCEKDCGPYLSPETECADGLDNDCNGAKDCADLNCASDSACKCAQSNVVEICDNGNDDDCNGDTDCDDSYCSDDPACEPASCLGKKADCDENSDCCSNRCHASKHVCL